jgi:hypothetical protein
MIGSMNTVTWKTKNRRKVTLLSVTFFMFLLSMLFLPRLSGQFRYEDLLIPLLLLTSSFHLKTSKDKENTILLLWIIYTCYLFVVTIANVIFSTLPLSALLVAGKEVQYALLFVTCLAYLGTEENREFFSRALRYIFVIIFGYVVLYLIANERSDYGLAYINDPSPTNSMLVYFHLFILSLLAYKENRSTNIFLFFSLAMFVFTFLVGNRTGQFGLIIFLFFLLFFELSVGLRMLYGIAVIALVLMLVRFNYEIYEILYYNNAQHPVIVGSMSRLGTLFTPMETFEASRLDSITSILTMSTENDLLFGCGRGCTHSFSYDSFNLGMGGDNQYTVNFVEIGAVGLVMHCLLFLSPYLYSAARKNKVFVAYTIAFFVMAMTGEHFQLPRGAQFYWLIAAFVLTKKMKNFRRTKLNLQQGGVNE